MLRSLLFATALRWSRLASDAPFAAKACAALENSITKENIAIEVAYLR